MDVEGLLREEAERCHRALEGADMDGFQRRVLARLGLDGGAGNVETVTGFEPVNNRFAGGPLGPLGHTVTD